MTLSECLCITYENDEELKEVDRVLSITKSVLSITVPMPTLSWNADANHVFIYADAKEFNIVKIVIQNNLGLFNEAPFDTPNFSEPQHRYAVPRLSTDENAVGLREVSADVGVSTTFVMHPEIEDIQRASISLTGTPRIELDPRIFAESEEEAQQHTVDYATAWAPVSFDIQRASDNDYHLCSEASGLTSDGEPNLDGRRTTAGTERSFATVWEGASVLDDSTRAQWQLVNERLNDVPQPTESSSGSISVEEQITFSEVQNPRHWNLVKCSYGGSRYYLTYICPPSVNPFDTLRIVGGIHAEDTPEIREICVYNSEPYWRELRHMMHQGVTSLREAVAA